MGEAESLRAFLHPNLLLQRLGPWRVGRSNGRLALLKVEGAPHQIVFSRLWRSF